ncbi:hypothetical protein PO909_018649, partial [Leuciscus waleckii]
MKMKYMETITFILTGVVCLFIIMNKNDIEDKVTSNSNDTYEMLRHQIHLPRSKTPQPLSSRCQQNMSAYTVTGFSTLPGHIQDFLLYRHCRNFPMLL